jgi:hypothetical protein
MHNETACQVSSLLTLLDGALLSAPSLPDPAAAAAHAERTFVFCLAWSLGGLLPEAERAPFDAELRAISPAAMPPKVGAFFCARLGLRLASALGSCGKCPPHGALWQQRALVPAQLRFAHQHIVMSEKGYKGLCIVRWPLNAANSCSVAPSPVGI